MKENNRFESNFGTEYFKTLPTLGKLIADILNLFGCSRVYGVGGDYVASLINELEPKVSLYPSSNELHAAYSACAAAEISGVGACLTTYTVGSLPCVSAAALAKSERLPVIFISGAPGVLEMNKGPMHHMIQSSNAWTFNNEIVLQVFSALGIRAQRLIGTPNDVQPSVAGEQFYNLVAHSYLNKEPVFIEIPRDIVREPVQAIILPSSREKACHEIYMLSGAELIADEIVLKLNASNNPVIFIGEKIKFNRELIKIIIDFCEKYRIPYATSLFSKGIVDEFNPLSLGTYNGVFSRKETREYLEKKCDYILEVCTSIYAQESNVAFGTGTYIVDNFLNRTALKGSSDLCLDVLEVFKFLKLKSIKQFYCQVSGDSSLYEDDEETILGYDNIASVLNEIQRKTSDSFVYIPEVGSAYFASFDLLTRSSKVGRNWLTNPWYAAMGTSLPYARALAHCISSLDSAEIPVVLIGDGGFNFQFNELIHFQREKLFAVILLFRNNHFQLGKLSASCIYQCNSSELDYKMLAQAVKGTWLHCEKKEDLRMVFENILKNKQGIHIIEIPVSVEEQRQSHTIRLLNCYIRSRSGDSESLAQWESYLQKT